MPKVSPILTNFTAGELSPQLEGRVDIARYQNAAQSIENFLIAPYGGVDRRPGTVFVAPAKYSDKKCRLIPFQFSTIQNYIIEVGDQYMRFFRDNAAVTESDVTITGATQADPVVITANGHGYSNGDTIIINSIVGMTELNGKRYLAANVAANTFEITDLDGVDIDGIGYTAYDSGGVANKVYEISTPYLEADLFGLQAAQSADIMWIVHQDYAPRKLSRLADTNWTLALEVFKGGPFQALNSDTAHTVTPSAVSGAITISSPNNTWTADHVGSFFKLGGLVGDVQGYVLITGFTNEKLINATTQEDLDGVGATDDWAYGSFSVEDGYPSCVAFHEQRLFYGGTLAEPQTIYGSVSLEFENFTTGSADDEALQYEIATEQVNAIRFISSGRGLAAGTLGGGFIVSSGQDFVPLTPSNVSVRRETTFGSELIVPRRIGNFLYYIQRGGRKIREYAYNFDIDSHRSLDMTLLADHVTETGIVDIAYQQSPNSILWCVREDGVVACLTRQIDQEVIGWTRIITAVTASREGIIESVAAIPSGEEDQVWMSANREVNGTVRRFIEYVSAYTFEDQDDAFFVDSGLSLDVPLTITAATAADPVVVTSTAHGLSYGDFVRVTDVVGMTELNGILFKAGYEYEATKTVTGATNADPIVITSASHGYNNGDRVRFESVGGMIELNNKVYEVANSAANTFTLTDLDGNDIDSSVYRTYTSGGTVAKAKTADFVNAIALTTIHDIDVDGSAYTAYKSGGELREAVLTLSGLEHLEGETVQILADGAVLPSETVTDGQITMDRHGAKVHVGLGYTSELESLRIKAGSATGTAQGKIARIYEVVVRLYRALGGEIGYRGTTDIIYYRTSAMPMDQPPNIFTGDKRVQFPKGYERGARVYVKQEQPLPISVLAIMPKMVVNDR